MHIHEDIREDIRDWEKFISRKWMRCNPYEKWIEPIDVREDYERILKSIASGEFQKLKQEVETLKDEIKLLKDFKKVLITEEILIEEWDNEYDARWDSC